MASTVHDVAKRAGVSVGTVSRFLNGHKLRAHNALKVEQAIRELDFTENLLAKGLKGNRSLTIAVLIPNLTGLFSFEIIKAMENVVEEQGYSLVIGDYEQSPQRLCKKLENLGRRSVDGLILFPLSYGEECREILEQYKHRGIPVILMDDRIPEFQTDIVSGDQSTASFRAVEHLIHNGHRSIAVITGRKQTNVTQERLTGCREAFRTYSIPEHQLNVVWCDYTLSGAEAVIKNLFESPTPPSGLYCTSYYITLGAVRAGKALGKTIPRDISLVGHDRFSATEVIEPQLTVVEFNLERHGREAGNLMMRRLRGDREDYPQEIKIQMKLSMGESVAPPGNFYSENSR
jgi:LacI family transcriptional regulator